MTQEEENMKNVEGILEAANKLPEDKKKVIQNIVALLETAADLMVKGKTEAAINRGFAPLVAMLTFEFLRQFVAEHMPLDEKLKLLAAEGLKLSKTTDGMTISEVRNWLMSPEQKNQE